MKWLTVQARRSSGFPQMTKAGEKLIFAWTSDQDKNIKVSSIYFSNFSTMTRFIFLLFIACLVSCMPKESERQETTPEPTSPAKIESGVEILAQSEADTLKGSLKSTANGVIGTAHFQINYHSPAVRDRIVWGGLFPK
ncbi:MAG: hypothetical protein U5K54_07895 [Cytophagales bacterium]|nr:hypothetical protein [Cytophagales bacterium]